MCFDTTADIPLGAASRMVVSELGDLPQPSSINGLVCRHEWDAVKCRFVVGVQFTSFTGMTRDELLEAIRRWEAQASACGTELPSPPGRPPGLGASI